MSSLRNSLHRRNHKERSQLSHRQRFGILEKHKDYVLRARDYHSKQDRIKRLRQKAADRNKDEFYFGMNRQRTEGGVHVQDRGNASLPVDMVKILKTQDENYVRTMRAAGLKKIEKLRDQLTALADLLTVHEADDSDDDTGLDEEELEILMEAGIIARPFNARKRRSSRPPAKHIVFVENDEEARQYAANYGNVTTSRSKQGDTPEAVDLGWRIPEKQKRGKKKDAVARTVDVTDSTDASKRREAAKAHRTRLLKELSTRLHRDRMLRYAERELEMQSYSWARGVERVDRKNDDSEDEDALDARHGRRSRRGEVKHVDEKLYKPRVYKWRSERKR
ncbi:u3 small nucleolar RNA-associated protein 11 [Lactifluus subvellereus]|nr:u3 small nucleolar RNA-associated protein 11 [Lactifluus subvellereus]